MASSVAVSKQPRAVVEKDGNEYVVVLLRPTGGRDYYVSTSVGSDNVVEPFVSKSVAMAKHFGLERNAKSVAGDMTAFLLREHKNLKSWV